MQSPSWIRRKSQDLTGHTGRKYACRTSQSKHGNVACWMLLKHLAANAHQTKSNPNNVPSNPSRLLKRHGAACSTRAMAFTIVPNTENAYKTLFLIQNHFLNVERGAPNAFIYNLWPITLTKYSKNIVCLNLRTSPQHPPGHWSCRAEFHMFTRRQDSHLPLTQSRHSGLSSQPPLLLKISHRRLRS